MKPPPAPGAAPYRRRIDAMVCPQLPLVCRLATYDGVWPGILRVVYIPNQHNAQAG